MHTPDFAAMSPDVKPTGDVLLTGTLHYRGASGEPLLRAVSIDGRIAREALAAASSGARLDLRRLRGAYQLRNGTLHDRNIDADTLSGQISLDVGMEQLDRTPVSTPPMPFRCI